MAVAPLKRAQSDVAASDAQHGPPVLGPKRTITAKEFNEHCPCRAWMVVIRRQSKTIKRQSDGNPMAVRWQSVAVTCAVSRVQDVHEASTVEAHLQSRAIPVYQWQSGAIRWP